MLQQDADQSAADAPALAAAEPQQLDDAAADAAAEFDWEAWAWFGGKLALAILVGIAAHWLVFTLARRLARRSATDLDDVLLDRLRAPSLLIFPLLALLLISPAITRLTPSQLALLRHIISIGAIAAATWLVVAIVGVGERFIKQRHRIDVADNLAARRVHTQITVLSRAVMVFIVILGAAAAVMTFPRMRELGMSLLVSAGFAGLAIGLAARPVLESLISGVQLAFTQPIRLDDVVIVEGEWGRIEDITTTYVVVKTWDERRLIVPFSKFISEPFENWTRTSADMLGTVMIHADYAVDVDAVRSELQQIVEASEHWDSRTCKVQVTDASERTVQLRVTVSAANSGALWNLRVLVREKLLAFMQREHPDWLPRTRVEMETTTAGQTREP